VYYAENMAFNVPLFKYGGYTPPFVSGSVRVALNPDIILLLPA
jgi:hypothetical protein